MGRQGGDRGDQPVADGFGVVPVGQVHQHRVAGGAFDERGDRGLVGLAHDQVAFPVAGHRPVLDLGGAVADHDHRVDEPVGALIGGTVRFAARPAGPKCLGYFAFESTAGLEVQRLVDRFVAHPHALVVREVLDAAGARSARVTTAVTDRLPPRRAGLVGDQFGLLGPGPVGRGVLRACQVVCVSECFAQSYR